VVDKEKKPARPALLVLSDPHAMRINQDLAREIGFENSLVLLQLEFLIRTSSEANYKNDNWWTYQTLKKLRQEYFPWWSEKTISRILVDLQTKKFISVGNFNKTQFDRTQWFSLNPEGLQNLKSVSFVDKSFIPDICHFDKSISRNDISKGQSDKWNKTKRQMEADNLTNRSGQIDTTIPETIPEITQREDIRSGNAQASLFAPSPSDFSRSEDAALESIPVSKVSQPPKQGKSKTVSHPFPQPFRLNGQHMNWAKENCPLVDWKIETEKFKDWALSKGEHKSDWHAAWRNWLRRVQEERAANPKIFKRPTSVVL